MCHRLTDWQDQAVHRLHKVRMCTGCTSSHHCDSDKYMRICCVEALAACICMQRLMRNRCAAQEANDKILLPKVRAPGAFAAPFLRKLSTAVSCVGSSPPVIVVAFAATLFVLLARCQLPLF